jgi:hypothetical protein
MPVFYINTIPLKLLDPDVPIAGLAAFAHPRAFEVAGTETICRLY